MPLFRGAASKAILAHIERRRLRRYFDEFASDIAKAGLGQTWTEFKACLRRIRATNISITMGELDVGCVGISAPIFSSDGEILGSLSLVVSEQALRRSDGLQDKLAYKVGEAAKHLTQSLANGPSEASTSSRNKKKRRKSTKRSSNSKAPRQRTRRRAKAA